MLQDGLNVMNAKFGLNYTEKDLEGRFLSIAKDSNLNELNNILYDKSFVLGGSELTKENVFLAGALGESISKCKKLDFLNVCRWYDFIQHKVEGLKSIEFELNIPAKALVQNVQKSEESKGESEEELKKKKKAEERRLKEEAAALEEITKLDIRVGLIVQVENHPSQPEDLYVEKIDLGEKETRTIVSGLAKFVPMEKMKGRLVAVATNLGEADIKGVLSNGLVLCASNEEHTKVEPLEPPAGSKPGEKIFYPGLEFSGEPDAKLNAKKWAKLKKKLKTSEEGNTPLAQFDRFVMTTSQGPVTVPTLKDSFIK
jgi:methionine--tRNA ligase beta chain